MKGLAAKLLCLILAGGSVVAAGLGRPDLALLAFFVASTVAAAAITRRVQDHPDY